MDVDELDDANQVYLYFEGENEMWPHVGLAEDEEVEMASDNSDEEEQPFDITLAATHSYMGSGLVEVAGEGQRAVRAGWVGHVPALAHHAVVFPGETVPMLLHDAQDAALISHALHRDKLFGLLFANETWQALSGYGVLCEVYEAGEGAAESGLEGGGGAGPRVTFKARAVHRFHLVTAEHTPPLELFVRLQRCTVRVLGEDGAPDPLRRVRVPSLAAHGRTPPSPPPPGNGGASPPPAPGPSPARAAVRRLEAAVTPWPRFVFEIVDYARMRRTIAEYFRSLGVGGWLPEDVVPLSFWAASNLTLAPRDRLALFAVDSALLRLHMACHFIKKKSALCCASCGTEISRREHEFAMSSEGVHSNYTNPGGYMHDVMTVRRAWHTRRGGPPSAEYSWFPGYRWSVALCACCAAHVGWRFDAVGKLRPRRFYGLCRNYVLPQDPDQPAAPVPAPALYWPPVRGALAAGGHADVDATDAHSTNSV